MIKNGEKGNLFYQIDSLYLESDFNIKIVCKVKEYPYQL